MADNRMWLIHKPSKLGIMLGKRMAWGWHDAPDTVEIQRFYDYLAKYDYLAQKSEGGQDDFILAMEDCSESSCFSNWVYTEEMENEFRKFELTDNHQASGSEKLKIVSEDKKDF